MKTKRVFLTLIPTFFFASLLFVSCSKEDSNNEYFVQYEWKINRQTGNTTIMFVTENGVKSITTQELEWSGKFGPLERGTKVFLSVHVDKASYSTVPYSRNTASIRVSQNGRPFVTKAEFSDKKDVYISAVLE